MILTQQLLTDVGDFPLMSKGLLGIKSRAEHVAASAV